MPLRPLIEALRQALTEAPVKAPKHVGGKVAKTLLALVPGVAKGQVEPVINVLRDYLATLMTIDDTDGLTRVITPSAFWYQGLGPKYRKRYARTYLELEETLRLAIRIKNKIDTNNAEFASYAPATLANLASRIEIQATKDIAWLEKVARDDTKEDLPHGPWTVTVMEGVSANSLGDCLDALDAATEKAKHRFPQVLYGKVIISKSVGMRTVATYAAASDNVALSVRAKSTVGDVHAILHELGHRYHHRFWKDSAQRDTFRKLSTETIYKSVSLTVRDREKLAAEFLQHADATRERGKAPGSYSKDLTGWVAELMKGRASNLQKLVQQYVWEKDDGVVDELKTTLVQPATDVVKLYRDEIERKPLAVSEYGKKSWTENFAEAFALYLLGKDLPPEIQEIMEALK